MPGKKLLIFDMDGTINDSSSGITYCFKKTCEAFGKDDVTEELLRTGLCGPFVENLLNIVGIEQSQVPEAVDIYVRHYSSEGQFMSTLFPDVPETLAYLRSKGYDLAVATLMVEGYALKTLEDRGILDHFDTVHGASLDVEYTKQYLIEQCLDSVGASPEESVMIGDGRDDHISAVKAGIDFIGVSYGYEIDQEYCRSNGIPCISRISDLRLMFRSVHDPEARLVAFHVVPDVPVLEQLVQGRHVDAHADVDELVLHHLLTVQLRRRVEPGVPVVGEYLESVDVAEPVEDRSS